MARNRIQAFFFRSKTPTRDKATEKTVSPFRPATAIGALTLLMAMTSACRPCRQMVENTDSFRTEALTQEQEARAHLRTSVDSVHVRDSLVTIIKGDSVITDRWHTIYRERLRTDTVERERLRTVYRTRNVQKRQIEVREKELSVWERIKLKTGGGAIALCAILGGIMVRRIWRRHNR